MDLNLSCFRTNWKKKIRNKLLHELNEIMIMAIKLSIGFGNTQALFSLQKKNQLICLFINTYTCMSQQQRKQQAHGPYRSPRKQFQSIYACAQSYVHTMTLIKREKRHYLFIENWMVHICLMLNSLHAPKDALWQVWLKLDK